MGKGGGGGSIVKMARSLVDDPLSEIGNIAVQAGTLGAAGLGSDGKLKKGFQVKALDEGIGEVSGRNMKRAAMNEANEKLTAEEDNRAKQLKLSRIDAERKDRQASMSARASRSKLGGGRAGSILGSDERDFLGL